MNSEKDKVKSVADSAKIDINKADAKTLQQLSGTVRKKHRQSSTIVIRLAKLKTLQNCQKLMV